MTTTTLTAPARRQQPRAATTLGLAGAALGTLAGLVELTVGDEIRSWIGDKHDTTRLGLATIVLSLLALVCATALRRRPDAAPAWRAAAGFGLLAPGLICFTTVGRLWYIPGLLLVAAGTAILAGLRGDAGTVVAATARNWTAILTGILGVLYLALGVTAHGLAGILGIAGGLATIALVAARDRLPRRRTLALSLVAAVAPFALATWWSLITPLLALLILVLGTTATATATTRVTAATWVRRSMQ